MAGEYDNYEIIGLTLTAGDKIYNLKSADIIHDAIGAPRTTCRAVIMGLRAGASLGKIIAGMTHAEVTAALGVLRPGTRIYVDLLIRQADGAELGFALYCGYVSSVMETMVSRETQFIYELSAELTSPETLMPTAPVRLTHRLSRAPGSKGSVVPLQSNLVDRLAMLNNKDNNNKAGAPTLSDHLNGLIGDVNSPDLNIAQILAEALDTQSTYESPTTTKAKLPSRIREFVDVENAPTLRLSSPEAARSVAKSAVLMALKLQANSISSDWSIFVQCLLTFFLTVVPKADDGTFAVVKNNPWGVWDAEEGDISIPPSDFTGFQHINPTAFTGYYRAVAIAYPRPAGDGSMVKSIEQLNHYCLCAAGYNEKGEPKWEKVAIMAVKSDGNYKANGIPLTNIRTEQMPNWAEHAIYTGSGSADDKVKQLDKIAEQLAVATLTSQLNAQGGLILHTRLLPTIDYLNQVGHVVQIKLPIGVEDGVKEQKCVDLYGMLRTVHISVILNPQGLTATGRLSIAAVRSQAEQDVFAKKSGLFTDEQ